MDAAGTAAEHPVRIVVDDDPRLNRLTVLFRLILALPHVVWIYLWTCAFELAVVLGWLFALAAGRLPVPFHRFLSAYVRYRAQLFAYLALATNRYPGFLGRAGYPVDVELPSPGRLARWRVLLRILLVLPALLLSSVLGLLALAAAFLGWFAGVALARMPKGLRDAVVYVIGFDARFYAYLALLTDRYPNPDPVQILADVPAPPPHPVHIVGDSEDLRRSRVTVFFRLVLAVPHLVWLYLWSVAALVAVIVQWFVALVRGRPADPLHRFVVRYTRYAFHVTAFLTLAANPFPGFVGAPGSYPLDLVLPPAERQNRWRTFFRLPLALPAVIVSFGTTYALEAAAVLLWFVGLVLGRAPAGLRNLAAYALRYQSQLYAYGYLVTGAYPHASPLEGAETTAAREPVLQPVS